MIPFENFKNNVNINDKFDHKNVNVSKGVTCSNINIIQNKKHEHEVKMCDPLMAAAVLGLNNTNTVCNPSDSSHTWTDADTHQSYLKAKPTCYLILCKPGAGAYSLGEALSKKLNCIHLCPRNVLLDEIEQNSQTGKCVDFNMRHNKVLKVNAIMPIIKKKLQSPAIQHRGYILTGLPLVSSNRSPKYLCNSLYAEESLLGMEDILYDLICNLQKRTKARKSKRESESASVSVSSVNEEEEEMEEEEEQPKKDEEQEEVVQMPKFLLDTCTDIICLQKTYMDTSQAVLIHQVNDIFNLEMSPDIIFYITSPDADLISKKGHKYMNYKSNLNTVDPFVTKPRGDTRWPANYGMTDYESPYDSSVFNSKYNCKHPINCTEQSNGQMCNYKNQVSSYLQNIFMDFKPKHIIKLDCRTTVHKMTHHIMERLHVLPVVKPVIIPEPLYLEEPPDDLDEFWNLVENLNVIRSGVVNFNRYPSPWFNRCPVELKNRKSVRGKPKLAVTFFNHVFLLSSLHALITFCRNPRPYLELCHLEPTCRIIVMGTKSSGKSMISECLSWLFDTPIINYATIIDIEKKKKYNAFSRTILSEIIATIEDNRYARWQITETERVATLNDWNTSSLKNLKKYIVILTDYIKLKSQQLKEKTEEETGEELIVAEANPSILTENDQKLLNAFNAMRRKLTFLPFLDDLEQCNFALQNKDLLQYAPARLLIVTERPAIPALGDDDVKQAISDYIQVNDLQKEIEPTPEEITNVLINCIQSIDTEAQQSSGFEVLFGKYIIDGFPSSLEHWDILSNSKLLPDNTISIIENREIEPELIQHYMNLEKCHKYYQERFILADDPFIKIKLATNKPIEKPELHVKNIVKKSVDDSLNFMFPSRTVNETEFLTSFSQSIDKFREDWDSLKLRLEEKFKSFIEVELETKSDVEIVEEVLLKLRQSYCVPFAPSEGEEFDDQEEVAVPRDMLTHNNPNVLCETGIYCPIAFYDHGVLWEGKPEFNVKYDNKIYNFSTEQCLNIFQKDVTKYQSYNQPFKKLPPFRICIMGCIGSGKTAIGKLLAKELGLFHIDFAEMLNDCLMPRHFKKVGLRHENKFKDIPMDEEGVMEFQMSEENLNYLSDILSNETELRRMVYNYLERGAPIMSLLMQKLIKKLWFENPFLETGFVIEGFPRLPTDVEDMITCFCIPDLVIDLEINIETCLDRMSPQLFKTWKLQLNEAKAKNKMKFNGVKQEWVNFITKKVVIKIVCDEIVENAISSVEVQPILVPSTESVIFDAHPSGSSNVDANLFNTYNEMILEFPEPVDESEWENADEARERIDSRLQSIFESDDENIQALKDILSEQSIKTVAVDGTKSLSKVFRVVLRKLSKLRNRNHSFFEQTFILNCDIAEVLLLEGFCFLSKFNRMCPVYLLENPLTILNPYKIGKRKGAIFPVVHRSFIYFVYGEESVTKFRTDPLKYIVNDKILSYHDYEYTLKIGIIGAPKSGKSKLAAKLAKRYGLMCVSKGMALRNIVENMHWTKLACNITATLEVGQCVGTDLIMRAVQTTLIDHRTETHGYVLDGFPDNPSEVMELSRLGLYPLIVFDISSNKKVVMNNSQNEVYYAINKVKPPYSLSFMEYRFTKWKEQFCRVRNCIEDDVQNLCALDGNESSWQCLQESINHLVELMSKIHYYLHNVRSNIVPAHMMCVSNKTFQQRISCFRNICPVCILSNTLKNSGYPVDKKGVVQYNNLLYWICSEHMKIVLENPEHYLNAHSVNIPEIPAVVKTIDVRNVYENGICIVTYAEKLPTQTILRGINSSAATYRGKTYLFCSAMCLEKFLRKPHMYYDITVFKETRIFPKICLQKLPNIGYLEQTVGNTLTEACCAVNVLRPKYPGLDIKLSGLLFIALYLKIHNPLTNDAVRKLYAKAFKIYEARSKLIIDLGLRLRSADNPFMNYPKCYIDVNKNNSGTVCKPSSVNTSSDPSTESVYFM